MILNPVMLTFLTSLASAVSLDSERRQREVYNGQLVNLEVCMMINRNTTLLFDYNRGEAAAELGKRYVEERVLPANVNLRFNVVDLGRKCEARDYALHHAMRLWETGIECGVFIGAGCTSSAINLHNYAELRQIPIIGVTAAGIGADEDGGRYPLLSRISVTHTSTARALARFLKFFNYTDVTILVETSLYFYVETYRVIRSSLPEYNEEWRYTVRYQLFSADASEKGRHRIRQELGKANNTSRVICIFAGGSMTRLIMLEAEKLGMTTEEYVYIALELFPSRTWGAFNWESGEADDRIAKKALESLIILSYDEFATREREVFDRRLKQLAVSYGHKFGPTDLVEPVTRHFFDAILLYASAVALVAENGTEDDIRNPEMVSQMLGKHLPVKSPLNELIVLDDFGDRRNNYLVKSFSLATDQFEPFLKIPISGNISFISDSKFWKGRTSLPQNSPRCGFRGNNPICKVSSWAENNLGIIIGVPGVLLPLSGIVAALLVLRHMVESYDPFWWRIFTGEIATFEEYRKHGLSIVSKSLVSGSFRDRIQATGSVQKFDLLSQQTVSARISKTDIVVYRDNCVHVNHFIEGHRVANASVAVKMRPLHGIAHQNLQSFYGIIVNDQNLCMGAVGELCMRGDLGSLLRDESLDLDDNFKYSLIRDLVSGMVFLHSSKLGSHGDLREGTCLIDSRFTLKISAYGLGSFLSHEYLLPPLEQEDRRDLGNFLWRAPEHLRKPMPPNGSPKGDVYSFSIILHQIIFRCPPFGSGSADWSDSGSNVKDIVFEVKRGVVPILRPKLFMSRCVCPPFLVDLMSDCWEEEPLERPSFVKIRDRLLRQVHFSRSDIVGHLLKRLEQYAENLERQVEEKAKQFMEEKQRTEGMLYSLLPEFVAKSINRGETVMPQVFESTTVFFSHLEGFDQLTNSNRTPSQLTRDLNAYYVACDSIVLDGRDILKVETINDGYLIVSGLPIPNGLRHATIIAQMALDLRAKIASFTISDLPNMQFQLRVGINSGSCVTGIIGLKLPRYCLFGDTINTASRMESNGEAGRIHVSLTTAMILLQNSSFDLVERGNIKIKGKGMMKTYWLSSAVARRR